MSVLEFKFHTWGKRDLKKGEGSLPLEAGWYTWMLLRVKCVFVSSTRTLEALTRIPHVVSTLIYLIYRTRAKYVALASGGCLRTGYRMSWDRCVCLSVCGGVRMCEVRTVAVLSDERGRVLSPTQSYWKRCSEPRLFQPQLIECICTQLHNDRWVSPQLTFFMFSLKKKRQSWPLFPHFSFCLSFSLCLFHLNFLKSGQKKKKKTQGGIFVSSRGMLLSHSGGEGGGEGGFTWLMSHSLSSTFLVALLLLSVGHKVTTQDSGSLRVAAWTAEFCPNRGSPRLQSLSVSDFEISQIYKDPLSKDCWLLK